MLFNDRLYNVLKAVAMIWLPALGAAYFSLAQIWHLPAADEVTGTVVVVDTFLGVILGISTKSYNASDAKYDGEILIEDHPDGDGSRLTLQNVSLTALTEKPAMLLKMNRD